MGAALTARYAAACSTFCSLIPLYLSQERDPWFPSLVGVITVTWGVCPPHGAGARLRAPKSSKPNQTKPRTYSVGLHPPTHLRGGADLRGRGRGRGTDRDEQSRLAILVTDPLCKHWPNRLGGPHCQNIVSKSGTDKNRAFVIPSTVVPSSVS